jgi:hypothetical protein
MRGGVLLQNVSMAVVYHWVRVYYLEAMLMLSGSCYERILFLSSQWRVYSKLELGELLPHVAVTSRH